MTSIERKQARYTRRRQRREEKRRIFSENYDNYDKVFTYGHMYDAYKMCRRGVGWKASTQKYKERDVMETYRNCKRMTDRMFRHDPFYEFWQTERGKKRFIQSVTVRERVTQRCLCDHSLVPLITRAFIYDNGASMKNKGYTFAHKRLSAHLRKYYHRYGQGGYVLLFDFSHFFENVSHDVIRKVLREAYTDDELFRLNMELIDAFGDTGLGLGSQISQVLALASANTLDHFIKEVLRIKYYARYMDDGYLIHRSKEYLRYCLDEIVRVCESLGIKLNRKKTHIVKLSHGFTYLKARVFLTESGRVVKKIYKRSVTVMRRKLKKFRRKIDTGKMTMRDTETGFQSWLAYAHTFDAYYTILNMKELYESLFGSYRGVVSPV